ncbi:hypothetical protein Bca52824_028476 [Brassica carinata]|uniref:Uncharacterized protein n=1 Tax=Brassica carinata TaxID=52824 RepID=A0A8X7VCJ9_BRACI|nr:hypothetical protein Bca52824_028476 [Brassica carinata]
MNNNWLDFSLSPYEQNHHCKDVYSSTTTTAVDVAGDYCYDPTAASDESLAIQTSFPSPFGVVLDAFTRDNNSHSRGSRLFGLLAPASGCSHRTVLLAYDSSNAAHPFSLRRNFRFWYFLLSFSLLDPFFSGINSVHLHTHRKQASDIDIKRRIRQWMRYVRGPRNLLLIRGDGGFASTLMDVEIHSHNTMVAYNEHSVSDLISYVGYSQFAWRELLQY